MGSQVRATPENLLAGTSLFEAFGYKFKTYKAPIGTGDTFTHTHFLSTQPFESQTGTYIPQTDDFRIFNPDDPQHELINTTDQDYIFNSGIQIRYYKIKPQEEQKHYNSLYGENPNREYENAFLDRNGKFAFLTEADPIVAWGLYLPSEMTQELVGGRIDTKASATIYFNILYIRNLIGRDPVFGDILIPWDLPEKLYEIRTVTPTNRTLYVPRRYKMTAELVQWSK